MFSKVEISIRSAHRTLSANLYVTIFTLGNTFCTHYAQGIWGYERESNGVQKPIFSLAAEFQATGYVELTEQIPESLRKAVARHVTAALDSGGRRRDLRIGVTGDSPRRYRLAGRTAIEAAGDSIPALYRSTKLHPLLSAVSGAPVFRVPYAPEEYVATRFEEPGDTHGWHWDDYSLALIWVTASPDEADGGTLEFIPDVAWDKHNPRVEEYVSKCRIHRRHPAPGTVYLLRADTMLHRVSPLLRRTRREILCLSFATQTDLERAITHETLEQLYGSPA
jgi:hypothetical protein